MFFWWVFYTALLVRLGIKHQDGTTLMITDKVYQDPAIQSTLLFSAYYNYLLQHLEEFQSIYGVPVYSDLDDQIEAPPLNNMKNDFTNQNAKLGSNSSNKKNRFYGFSDKRLVLMKKTLNKSGVSTLPTSLQEPSSLSPDDHSELIDRTGVTEELCLKNVGLSSELLCESKKMCRLRPMTSCPVKLNTTFGNGHFNTSYVHHSALFNLYCY